MLQLPQWEETIPIRQARPVSTAAGTRYYDTVSMAWYFRCAFLITGGVGGEENGALVYSGMNNQAFPSYHAPQHGPGTEWIGR